MWTTEVPEYVKYEACISYVYLPGRTYTLGTDLYVPMYVLYWDFSTHKYVICMYIILYIGTEINTL